MTKRLGIADLGGIMFLVILLLLFFGVNWVASYLLAILPIHFLSVVGSFIQLMVLILVLLLFSWFFGD